MNTVKELTISMIIIIVVSLMVVWASDKVSYNFESADCSTFANNHRVPGRCYKYFLEEY